MRNLGGIWHSSMLGPRDALDQVMTECGLTLNLPVLLESYPGGLKCNDCGAHRLLTEMDA